MPGVAWRSLAIIELTLMPGSWPPSPGLAPCAILISSSRQLVRYSAVTPKRPDATCLIADEALSPFGFRRVARGILAALAGVRLGADAVHGDRQGLVRLGAERAERDAGRHQALADFGDRLRPLRAAPECRPFLKSSRSRSVIARSVVRQDSANLLDRSRRSRWRPPAAGCGSSRLRAHGSRPTCDSGRSRRPAAPPHPRGTRSPWIASTLRWMPDRPMPEMRDGHAGEEIGDQRARQADRLEIVAAAIGRQDRDAHLGHDLEQALVHRLLVVAHAVVEGQPRRTGRGDGGRRCSPRRDRR